MKKLPVLILAWSLSLLLPAAGQSVLNGPPGSGQFGKSVVVLPNGNFVVTDPFYDSISPPVTDVGAVYLYSANGTLISTLYGNNTNDQVGSGGITVLTNGHFVVSSIGWNGSRGVVTWGNSTTGFTGGDVVSASNSLIGVKANDRVGNGGVIPLSNGNYVVCSSEWDNDSLVNAGAVTWGNGSSGTSGPVSPANSLVGSTANDRVGNSLFGITALNNGNYVVRSPDWDNGGIVNAGAVTWGNGITGISGPVSTSNSLTGAADNDEVGSYSVTPLTNGNFVVSSPRWNGNRGAVTWGNGSTGSSGAVNSGNSLVGSAAGDEIGSSDVSVISNGTYVFFVGVTALTNGNYVVVSPKWNSYLGAVTWGNGSTGNNGAISSENSLVGSTVNDSVGRGGATALHNGNYVVSSPYWFRPDGEIANAGAATWCDGSTVTSGPVSAANSLSGSRANDYVGLGGVTALSNGHYLVCSYLWDNGGSVNAGAVTWGDGQIGRTGVITPANSLIGSKFTDRVGSLGAVPLTNGNFVVRSHFWNNSSGAVTWMNGSTSVSGVVSPKNSLIGSKPDDQVGSREVIALNNGNYVVVSPIWDNAGILNAGAVTWGNGSSGSRGPISAKNSLVGSTINDQVGSYGVTALSNSHYVIDSPFWDNQSISNVGAVTFGFGGGGVAGMIHSGNSVIGSVDQGGTGLSFGHDAIRHRLFVGYPSSNRVTRFQINIFPSICQSKLGAPPAETEIAYGKLGSAAVSATGGTLSDASLTGSGASKGRNRGLFATTPDSSATLVLQTGTAISSLAGGLPENASATHLGSQLFHQPNRGLFQATIKGTGINANNNRLLLLDNGNDVSLLLRSGQLIGTGALTDASVAAFTEVLQSHDDDRILLNYRLRTGGSISKGNDTGILLLDHEGHVSPNIAAQEGTSAFGGDGTFGQFTGRAAAARGDIIHFTALFKPDVGKALPAVFRMSADGMNTARDAVVGSTAPATGGATFRAFTGLGQFGASDNALVRATLAGSPAASNEGLWSLPANVLLTRKGDDIGGGLKVARILRFWPAAAGQVILHVQLSGTGVKSSNNQALVLRQADDNYLILLRTGSPAPDAGSSVNLRAITAVDVNPVSGHYAIVGTLSGAPAASNQALWTGDAGQGNDTTEQSLRHPVLSLRKGDAYSTEVTPYSLIRSIALKPGVDPTGAGGRGLAQAIGSNGHLALYLTGDKNLIELIVLDR